MIDRVSYDRGVHLRGTPLWFDAEQKRELCVVCGIVDKLPPAHARSIATAELSQLLGRAGHRGPTLPTPWDRWVGVGGHQLKLLDVGARPAGSAALLAGGGEHVLVAGMLREASEGWPRAGHLVAHVPALGHRGGTLEQALAGVRAFAEDSRAQGRRAAVLVESVDVGLTVLAALRGAGLSPRALGLLAKLDAGESQPQVSVGLARLRAPSGARVAFIDTGLGECGIL